MEPQKKKLPVYRCKLKSAEDGVFAISLVRRPAVEIPFQLYNEQEAELKFEITNTEKRYATGIFMLSDTPIYQIYAGKEILTEFQPDDLQTIVQHYFKFNKQSNWNLNHNDLLQIGAGVTLVESWFTEPGEKISGKEIPKGSWAGTLYFEDQTLWDDFVKNPILGLTGFSIEGIFSLIPKEEDEIYKQAEQVLQKMEKEISELFKNKEIINGK